MCTATRPAMKKVAEVPTEDLVLTYQTSQRDTLRESTPPCVRVGPIKEQMCRHTEMLCHVVRVWLHRYS